jgi:NAD(P)-dependent dehydrogenase (short-subunit alcohol dehydrogenase family)
LINTNFALVTGAGGFLGSHICTNLSRLNFNLICLEKDKKKINLLKSLLKKFNNKVFFFNEDICNEKSLKKINNFFLKRNYFINVIINNAAINKPVNSNFEKLTDPKSWKEDLNVGLLGAHLVIKNFCGEMIKRKEGSIINIGSDLSIISPNHEIYHYKKTKYLKPISYSAIKHGLVGINKYYSTFLGKYSIISNMISPGPIDNKIPDYLKKRIVKNTPMKKLCPINEVIAAIVFFSNTKNRHITGQNLIIDGGRSLI